jgi:5-methyltetrahydropteroyltriglutamate--homocysteine methyltransferase
MLTHNLGYPRIGSHRELKKANENYWSGKIPMSELQSVAKKIRKDNWLAQKNAGIDLVPCHDFSFYDHVLDMSLLFNAIPARFKPVAQVPNLSELDLYFAMARGYQKEGLDITAMEMTKWFDTNYHYIVPEFTKRQTFALSSNKIFQEFLEAKEVLGRSPKPVLLSPVSYLLLGKEKEEGFHRLSLLDRLLPEYISVLQKLEELGAEWVQIDEPALITNLNNGERAAIQKTYLAIQKATHLKVLVATYFECTGDNIQTAVSLPIHALHVDLIRCPLQLDDMLATDFVQSDKLLSLGVVDGRNIWKNDFEASLKLIQKASVVLGKERLLLAPSCSLLHVPCDLDLETNTEVLSNEIKTWMAFAKQKLKEVATLSQSFSENVPAETQNLLKFNKTAQESRRQSPLIHKNHVKQRISNISESDSQRKSPFAIREQKQHQTLNLPLMPTTTIGSFPQTEEIRTARSKYKRGEWNAAQYEQFIKEETRKVVQWQEEIGLDVLVHGEYERNDMVEYFGELLDGVAFTENGWVQSYGSRCVKPPVIYGDVERKEPMTIFWSTYAQSLTKKFVKGMLTGPVTILQWSFVRDDQPRKTTCFQIALAIRNEVVDLEKAGIQIIQIDEPAIREGLPIRKENWNQYLNWAVTAFRISASGVKDETQIHTHMCYSEFNDILPHIAQMDADVITIETSRSQMELLEAFADFKYPNEIGPGVYDIHSPRVPTKEEMLQLLEKAIEVLPARHIWVNPDCGLKTRKWPETASALKNMVEAALTMRELIKEPIGQ